MTLSVTTSVRENFGSATAVIGTITGYSATYVSGEGTLTAAELGLNNIQSIILAPKSGYTFQPVIASDQASAVITPVTGAAGTSGATSAGTPAGTCTVSTAVDTATPVFSGTGQSSAGQVITTTDNVPSMTLNQCAGMWFVSATHGPYLIESNTAVTNAPAVLTIYGTAPTTDAGTYRIYKSAAQVFAGSALATHTHTVAAAAGAEVANGTNLSSLSVAFIAIGD